MQLKKFKIFFFFLFLLAIGWLTLAFDARASRIDDLKSEIGQQSGQIAEIEKEIAEYQKQIDETLDEASSLKNEISRLETSRRKILSSINLKETQINSANLNIERLGIEIGEKGIQINDKKNTLAELIRKINEVESQSIIEIMLGHESFSEFYGELEQMDSFQDSVNINLNELKDLKIVLIGKKDEEKVEKESLIEFKDELIDQKSLTEINKSKKNTLLAQTKNKETNYRKLMEKKQAQKEAFEREILELEARLRIEIDPNNLPPTGEGILAWPLNTVKITQYFGNTPFATRNSQIYNGRGHTGVDFRASTGTKIKAASSGIVEGVGNTDKIRGCYSFGKWVLVKHHNGLSTLYAHLSLIKVDEGDQVTVGQTIGYSGATGYATGPHLHFGVYASQGVKITKFTNSVNCKNAYVPIADKKAYLNPLSYL